MLILVNETKQINCKFSPTNSESLASMFTEKFLVCLTNT